MGLFLACFSLRASADFRIYKGEFSYLMDSFPQRLLFSEGLKMNAVEKAVTQCRAAGHKSCEVKATHLAFERNQLASRVKAQAIVHGLSAPQLQESQKYTAVRKFFQTTLLNAEELQGVKGIALQSAMLECQQAYFFCSFESVELIEKNGTKQMSDEGTVFVSEARATVVGYPPEDHSFLTVEPEPEEFLEL